MLTGLGFFQVLTIIFIMFKLLHYITWSWFLVLAPLWGPWVLIIIGFCVYLTYTYIKEEKARKRRLK